MRPKTNVTASLATIVLAVSCCLAVVSPVGLTSCESVRSALFEPVGTVHMDNIRGVSLRVAERLRMWVDTDTQLGEEERAALSDQVDAFEAFVIPEKTTVLELAAAVGGLLELHDAYLLEAVGLSDNAIQLRLEDTRRIRSVIAAGSTP